MSVSGPGSCALRGRRVQPLYYSRSIEGCDSRCRTSVERGKSGAGGVGRVVCWQVAAAGAWKGAGRLPRPRTSAANTPRRSMGHVFVHVSPSRSSPDRIPQQEVVVWRAEVVISCRCPKWRSSLFKVRVGTALFHSQSASPQRHPGRRVMHL